MSNYVKTVNYASKDGLAHGNPLKTVKGTELDNEFNNIAVAVATKEDTANKGAANGYAGLDSGSKIFASALPSVAVRNDSAQTIAGALTITAPASGSALSITAAAASNAIIMNTTGVSWTGMTLQENGVSKWSIYEGNAGTGILTFGNAGSGTVLSMNQTGNVTINAPSSGTSLAVSGVDGYVQTIDAPTDSRLAVSIGGVKYGIVQATSNLFSLSAVGASASMNLNTAGSVRVAVNQTGNVTIAAPSSGTTLTANGGSGLLCLTATNAGTGAQIQFGNGNGQGYLYGNGASVDFMSGSSSWPIRFGYGATTMSVEAARISGTNQLIVGATSTPAAQPKFYAESSAAVSYTHLTLPTNREV